jgi:hypothetical protein
VLCVCVAITIVWGNEKKSERDEANRLQSRHLFEIYLFLEISSIDAQNSNLLNFHPPTANSIHMCMGDANARMLFVAYFDILSLSLTLFRFSYVRLLIYNTSSQICQICRRCSMRRIFRLACADIPQEFSLPTLFLWLSIKFTKIPFDKIPRSLSHMCAQY